MGQAIAYSWLIRESGARSSRLQPQMPGRPNRRFDKPPSSRFARDARLNPNGVLCARLNINNTRE